MLIAALLLWLASSTTQLSLSAMGIKLVLGIVEVWLLCGVYTKVRIANKN